MTMSEKLPVKVEPIKVTVKRRIPDEVNQQTFINDSCSLDTPSIDVLIKFMQSYPVYVDWMGCSSKSK